MFFLIFNLNLLLLLISQLNNFHWFFFHFSLTYFLFSLEKNSFYKSLLTFFSLSLCFTICISINFHYMMIFLLYITLLSLKLIFFQLHTIQINDVRMDIDLTSVWYFRWFLDTAATLIFHLEMKKRSEIRVKL